MTTQTTEKDPFADFKAQQREGWAGFAALEAFTTPPAAKLAAFAGVQAGEKVLDVACGTGVVAITAARQGASVTGLDLTPPLLERARFNAAQAGVTVEFIEGDAERLPFADASFDVVVSQFGHMFAPRPEVAIKEMLRVLKSGGRIAFSTWPPELYVGKMFALTGQFLPPPAGAAAPPLWGDPSIVRERLGDAVKELRFHRERMFNPGLSPRHFVSKFEETAAPIKKVIQTLKDQPAKLAEFRASLEQIVSQYFQDNQLMMDYLMTRALKK
jgi:SAM-dependent methyltransferase